jgi:soluble lytic murein transglycosylase-like protein
MRNWISGAAVASAALAMLAPVVAGAQARSAQEYFLNHVTTMRADPQLNQPDREYYAAVFSAIDREQWDQARDLLAQRQDGLLHTVAQAAFYTARNSPRVEAHQIAAWLERGTQLPMAEQLVRLGATRGLQNAPPIPMARAMTSARVAPRRTRPRTTEDGTMPDSVRQAILARIDNDDPDGARLLLDGVDATLSAEARAEWRQRVAWSYYIENLDGPALALAQSVAQAGTGAWLAEAEWTAGLAAWRLANCEIAGPAFERAAYHAQNPELRAAGFYWAARSALRCRQPERSAELLRGAAGQDETLYGMLALEQLGQAMPPRLSQAALSDQDWQRIGGIQNVRIAVALMEIGQDRLASQVLLHQARIGDPADYAPLSRLARDLGLPSTQLYMAHNVPSGGSADPASQFPAPKWIPVGGWKVDPALAFAHTLQESNFQARAVSPAQAQGLMQITPITVRQHAPSLGMNAASVDIFDPAINLAFGQRNLEMLRDDSGTGGLLPKIMAAYNAGLTPIRRWNSEVRDQGDPLLYMESIPYWETRSYVAIVMRNYWMYERQAIAPSPSRLSLAQNTWPAFPQAQPGSMAARGN